MRRIFSVSLVSLLLLATACQGTKSKRLDAETQARVDDLVREAKSQYEEGQWDTNAYNKAFELTGRALELDKNDLEAKMIRAWTLLQTGRFVEWENAGTKNVLPGARESFNHILEVSPNEYRARQGLAAIDFKEYHNFARNVTRFERLSAQFTKVIEMVAVLPPQAQGHRAYTDAVGNILVEWKAVDETYRDLQANTPGLFRDPDANDTTYVGGENWTGERFKLDEVMARFRREAFHSAVPHLEYFVKASNDRAVFWDLKSLTRLQNALKGFEDLERTGGSYYHVKHDLALAHIAMGEYFLRKALIEAEADFRRRRPDVQLPANEMTEVVASFFADESLHKNSRRAVIKEQFALAAAKIKEYVKLDEARERTGEARIDESRQAFTASAGENAVVSDVLSGYVAYSREVIREMRARRKTLILNMLMIQIFPQFLNQDLTDAKIWASDLYNIDVGDPISFFIKGMIFERTGELELAIDEYQRFLDHSSIALHFNRREWARDRLRRAKMEVERRRIESSDHR